MALEAYRQKRDFGATPEPRGRKGRRRGDRFVVQKHDARRLHYDFRLEMDGVLKSWAVAKGPSLVPGEKRLAVHVEDHPLEYGDFEGTIPKGEYGGGTVILWDRGRWVPVGDPHQGYAKGHLEFELEGEKLHGLWHLVRMARKPRDKHENWLLIKGEDEEARAPADPDILEERPESVKTGRLVADVEGEAPGWSSKTGRIRKARGTAKTPAPPAPIELPDPSTLKGAKRGRLPDFVEPALATLTGAAPSGGRWLHEIKFDGYRVEVRIDAGRVRLLTRSGLDWTAKLGKEIVAAFKALPVGTALIDGELVVEKENGLPDFSALQAALSEGRTDRFLFYGFDLLFLDGFDLRAAPLIVRKEALEKVLAGAPPVLRYSAHFDEDGGRVFTHACRLSLEGIVSKLRDAPYRSGRSKVWLKAKCVEGQEVVIAGYVPSTSARRAIGSLVAGVYDGDALVHAGRIGTGYTAAVSEDLYRRLERLRIPTSPFAQKLDAVQARQVRFVRPELVAEVGFRGWTADGSLRHAVFQGLREDKDPREVVREMKQPSTGADGAPIRQASIRLTHPDRLYWPDAGVTKAGLADYYAGVWERIAPFITGRPLSLVRGPEGIAGQCFFQKHAWKGVSASIRSFIDPTEKDEEPYLLIDDFDGLMGLVQAGVLEIHPWGSTAAAIEQPDMIIMDLDPGENVGWEAMIAAAAEVRDRFTKFGLPSFVKTSGGKGLHVVAPLKPKADWDTVKAFSKTVAEAMAADTPDRYVATITKSKRNGRILVDYLRNGRGATAVAPYSTRARAGAPVSMPLAWDELGSGIGAAYFTVANAPARLASIGVDPWADFRKAAVVLPPAGKSARKRRAAA